jgi:NAD-dependent dihydropyrimidine dehydrogenase PreA subunit
MLWYNVAGPPTHGLWVLRADPTDRYRRVRGREGDEMVYIIAEPCIDVKDKACVEECPVDCIYEGARMLYIHPEECIDCAACEPVCPVEAIFYEDDTPDEWKEFIAVNREWFGDDVSGLGDPGGAATVGAVDVDHPKVASWEM